MMAPFSSLELFFIQKQLLSRTNSLKIRCSYSPLFEPFNVSVFREKEVETLDCVCVRWMKTECMYALVPTI